MPATLKTTFTNIHLQKEGGEYYLVGSYQSADGARKECAPFPLDMVIGVGVDMPRLIWGGKGFSSYPYWTKVELDGDHNTHMTTRSENRGHPAGGGIELNDHFGVCEGPGGEKGLMALNVPVVVHFTVSQLFPGILNICLRVSRSRM